MERRAARRRARAGWVRAEPSRALHAILGRFDRERQAGGLTDRQEWLWDQVVLELVWRKSHEPVWSERCRCAFCWTDPFYDQVQGEG